MRFSTWYMSFSTRCLCTMVALYTFATFFHHCFYLVSAYLVMYIVDLYLCQWPPSLYYCGGTLLAQYWVSAQCYSNSCISCSLSTACRCSAFWLIYLGVLPLRQGLAPHIYFNIWCISFSTGCFCTVATLYIAIMSMQTLSGGTTASRFIIVYSVRLQASVILYRH